MQLVSLWFGTMTCPHDEDLFPDFCYYLLAFSVAFPDSPEVFSGHNLTVKPGTCKTGCSGEKREKRTLYTCSDASRATEPSKVVARKTELQP